MNATVQDWTTASPELKRAERKLNKLRRMYSETGFHKPEVWMNAPATYADGKLNILNHPVMEDWEQLYMRQLAKVAVMNGGHVVEIGFGMGISAGFIQELGRKNNLLKHTIIEANHDVAELARRFCQETATSETEVLEGLSYDVIDQIPDGSIDGILHDAYPLTLDEVNFQVHSAKTAYRKLKPGGVFTYFSDEIARYRQRHWRALLAAGFLPKDISAEIVAVEPPKGCRYWNASSILAPIAIKSKVA